MVQVDSYEGTDHLALLSLLFCLQMRQSIFVTYAKWKTTVVPLIDYVEFNMKDRLGKNKFSPRASVEKYKLTKGMILCMLWNKGDQLQVNKCWTILPVLTKQSTMRT